MKFEKKPEAVDALQFDGTHEGMAAITLFASRPGTAIYPYRSCDEVEFSLETAGTSHPLKKGDYVIRSNPTTFTSRVDILSEAKFEATYAPASKPAASAPKKRTKSPTP